MRGERAKKKLEKAYSFMIRVRLPGGVTTSKQWLALDAIAGTYANHTLRLTTRQTFQFHGVIKSNMKRTMQAINAALLDTLAACGDVNRNVLAASNPYLSKVHAAAHELAVKVSEHLLPQTGAYHEIWLDGEQVIDESAAGQEGRGADLRHRTICRANSRSSSPCRRRTTSTSSRTTSATSPSSRRASSSAGTSPSAAAWA